MIKIKRDLGYADRLRAYKVVLDGNVVGEVKNGKKLRSMPQRVDTSCFSKWTGVEVMLLSLKVTVVVILNLSVVATCAA